MCPRPCLETKICWNVVAPTRFLFDMLSVNASALGWRRCQVQLAPAPARVCKRLEASHRAVACRRRQRVAFVENTRMPALSVSLPQHGLSPLLEFAAVSRARRSRRRIERTRQFLVPEALRPSRRRLRRLKRQPSTMVLLSYVRLRARRVSAPDCFLWCGATALSIVLLHFHHRRPSQGRSCRPVAAWSEVAGYMSSSAS